MSEKIQKKRVILDMALGSSRVRKGRTVINSSLVHKDIVVLSGWSKPQLKQRFESALACLRHRDDRTYAQVLSTKIDNAHKRVVNSVHGHYKSPVFASSAPK